MKILKKLGKKQSQNSESTLPQHYSEIYEFPLLNWIKCSEGDVRFINKDRVSRDSDMKNWIEMYDLYVKKYGISKDLTDLVDDKKRLIELRNQFIQSGELSILNEINIRELELEMKEDQSSSNQMTIEKTLPILSKWAGRTLSILDLTIVEYKNYVLEYERTTSK